MSEHTTTAVSDGRAALAELKTHSAASAGPGTLIHDFMAKMHGILNKLEASVTVPEPEPDVPEEPVDTVAGEVPEPVVAAAVDDSHNSEADGHESAAAVMP